MKTLEDRDALALKLADDSADHAPSTTLISECMLDAPQLVVTLEVLGEAGNGADADDLYNVGQRVRARILVDEGEAVACNWTLGGDPIGGYLFDDMVGDVFPLEEEELGQPLVTFYWVRGGTYDVDVQVNVRGGGGEITTVNLTRTCIVAGPVAFRAEGTTSPPNELGAVDPRGNVALRVIDTQRYVSSGSPHGPHGVDFIFEFENPNLTGQFNTVQVFEYYHLEMHPVEGDALIVTGEEGTSYLDETAPYGEPTVVEAGPGRLDGSDSPSLGLDDDFRREVLHLDGRMVLMYRPEGDNSIWVAVACVRWEMRLEAIQGDDGWGMVETSRCEVVEELADYTEQPTWVSPVTALLGDDDEET